MMVLYVRFPVEVIDSVDTKLQSFLLPNEDGLRRVNDAILYKENVLNPMICSLISTLSSCLTHLWKSH